MGSESVVMAAFLPSSVMSLDIATPVEGSLLHLQNLVSFTAWGLSALPPLYMHTLEEMHILNCTFVFMPDLEHATKLTELHCNNCNLLVDIPNINKCTNLVQLTLHECPLLTLTLNLRSLTNLRTAKMEVTKCTILH